MKKILVLICSVIIFGSLFLSANADGYYLTDNADLLSEKEKDNIEQKLKEVVEELDIDIVILTEDYIGIDIESYAAEYYEDNGYSEDGIILVVDMGNREWGTALAGFCEENINDDGYDHICDGIEEGLGAKDYEECFDSFIDRCEEVTALARNGESYKAPFNFFMTLVICLVVGFAVALIVTLIMKGQLKSVRAKSTASDYLKKDSLKITLARDIFLYRQVTRTLKPDSSSSSHTSSSGRSYSTRSGKF